MSIKNTFAMAFCFLVLGALGSWEITQRHVHIACDRYYHEHPVVADSNLPLVQNMELRGDCFVIGGEYDRDYFTGNSWDVGLRIWLPSEITKQESRNPCVLTPMVEADRKVFIEDYFSNEKGEAK